MDKRHKQHWKQYIERKQTKQQKQKQTKQKSKKMSNTDHTKNWGRTQVLAKCRFARFRKLQKYLDFFGDTLKFVAMLYNLPFIIDRS